MTEKELRSEIAAKKLRNVYIFHGVEQYAMRRMITSLADFVTGKDDDFNRVYFDGATSVQNVFDAVYSLPFLAEKKFVAWADMPITKLSDKEISSLDGIVSDCPASTVLLLYFETVDIDPKRIPAGLKKLISAAQKSGGAVCEFSKRTPAELNKMLCEGASRRGCLLAPSVASYMTEFCGDDLSTLVGELSKVCSYANGGNVTKEIVDKVCSKNVDVSIYDLSKKLLALDMQGVYRVLDDLLYERTPAGYILSVLAATFIDIFRASVIKSEGKLPENFAKDFGYTEKTSFRLKNAARDASRISQKGIEDALAAIANCDATLKSTRVSEKTVLEQLVTELAVIIERSR